MEWCFPNCFVWWTVGFQNIEIILKGHMMWFQVFLASSYDPFNWRDVYLHLRFTQMYVKIQKNRKHCDFKSSFVWKISVLCSVLKQTLLKTNGICNTSQEMILKYKLFKPFMHITLRVARGMKSFITIVHVKPLNYCWPFLDFFFFDLCVASVMLILWLDGCPALSSVFCQLISICHYQIVLFFLFAVTCICLLMVHVCMCVYFVFVRLNVWARMPLSTPQWLCLLLQRQIGVIQPSVWQSHSHQSRSGH